MSAMTTIPDIKQEYWTNCPMQSTENKFQGLKGDIHFVDTVDHLVSIQRGLRLKDVWICTMNIIAKERREAILEEWLSEVPFAIENMLGTWINRAKENEVYWLLKCKILCFIIHEIPIAKLCFHREDPKNFDFNGFDHIAQCGKASINAVSGQEGMPLRLPILLAEDQARSSPWVQGWNGEKHTLLEEIPKVLMKPYRPPASVSQASRNLSPKVADTLADALEPEEDDLDKDTSCFCPVSSWPDDCEQVCYDQVERRELYFIENFEVPLGAVSNIDLFGFPAPDARFVELSDRVVMKEYQASHWLYTEHMPKKGTIGQRAPTPPPAKLPLRSTLKDSNDKLPTQAPVHSITASLCTPINLELEESSSQNTTLSDKQTEERARIDAIAESSSNSHFPCFEGLPSDWETCRSWFYGMVVSSQFVWINQMYRTVSNSHPLIWVDMKNNKDMCKLRGYLTHRTTQDHSLIISHFVSEATFTEAIQHHTDKWERPTAPLPSALDDPMEGPSQPAPLKMWLTSPRHSLTVPDVTLLHRAGVTLEERVEKLPCLLELYIEGKPYVRVSHHHFIITICTLCPSIKTPCDLFYNTSSWLSTLSSAHSHQSKH
ncbi:hypothetical protein K443DRAFT_135695 [Laccaria amethystina LaAM-08-1]|uniref:Uncharacterized protein n=1 Tax=Laccaria amethystina LaAM-08-1 TaxID=1095629 RepID=A0A0C9WGY2_9AGAR|nr:hypothetical protein K443DRAFT_135695 [Laccaria amethystina LaAM-08-1]